jgi:hypothetical protein
LSLTLLALLVLLFVVRVPVLVLVLSGLALGVLIAIRHVWLRWRWKECGGRTAAFLLANFVPP